MTMRKEDDKLISKLLNETYEVFPSQDVSKSSKDLSEYFAQKSSVSEISAIIKEIEHFSKKSGIIFQDLEYLSSIGCYRINKDNATVDFPSNWSSFSKLHELQGSSGLTTCDEKELGSFLLNEAKEPVIYLVNVNKRNVIIVADQKREFESKWISKKCNQLEEIFLTASDLTKAA